MNILVFHPRIGHGSNRRVVSVHTSIESRSRDIQAVTKQGKGITDLFQWQGYVFYGAPKVPFWVVTDLDLPLDLPFDFNKVGDKIYKCHTWVPAVILYLQKSYSSWKITLGANRSCRDSYARNLRRRNLGDHRGQHCHLWGLGDDALHRE